MKIYIVPGSPSCRKVQATVEYLGIKVNYIEIDIFADQHKSIDFLKINPNGKLPVLVDGDFSLWESNAITQYLGTIKPSTLYPETMVERCDIHRWQCWELAHYGKAVGVIVWESYLKNLFDAGETDEAVLKRATEEFHQFAPVLEAQLDNWDYVLGQNITIADFSLAAFGAYVEKAGLPLARYPNIKAWYKRMDDVPAWKHTQPHPMPQKMRAETVTAVA